MMTKKTLKHFSQVLSLIVVLTACSTTPSTHQTNNERDPASFQSCLITMNNIIGYKPHFGVAASDLTKAKTLQALEADYGSESLIDIQRRLSDAEIKQNNAHIKVLLAQPFHVEPIAGKSSYVTKEEADIIYSAMSESKVHKNHYCYDTKGTIGFCFGRATIAHMEAVVRNVNPEAIRKIWIAGDMGVWGHHVATMVKTDKGWLVLDTNVGHAITTDEWIAKYMPMKVKDANDIMVFTTQAGRFSPYDTQTYNAVNLFNTHSTDFDKASDYYRGYFHDYFDDLDNVERKPLFLPK